MRAAASRILAGAMTMLALAIPIPGKAYYSRSPDLVGPPTFLENVYCRLSTAPLGGNGPGMVIPFPALRLGAPVARTTTSFTTGGGGTSNAMLAAQRKRAGLPYKPPTVDGEKPDLPATFAVERGAPMARAPYQKLPLAPSKRLADYAGLIFAQATSPTRGRIAALTLYLAGRPAARPRLRMTVTGPADHGCGRRSVDVYAPAMSAAAASRLFAASGCNWTRLGECRTRAAWPHGRVLFVAPWSGNTYEYRWIDYDMLADWYFAATR